MLCYLYISFFFFFFLKDCYIYKFVSSYVILKYVIPLTYVIYISLVQIARVTLNYVLHLSVFFFGCNLKIKIPTVLGFLLILYMLIKFQYNLRLILCYRSNV